MKTDEFVQGFVVGAIANVVLTFVLTSVLGGLAKDTSKYGLPFQ